MEGKNIYQRLNAVREQVKYLQKDAKVQGYRAITHDQVTSFVRPHFVEQGIMVVPVQLKGELRSAEKATDKGTPYTFYIGMYRFDFINIDEPNDNVSVTVEAIGEDLNDKGPGKALSYAKKYAILKILEIETGESDESRYDNQNPDYITDDQLSKLVDMIDSTQSDEKMFLKFMGVSDLKKITTKNYNKAFSALQEKMEKSL